MNYLEARLTLLLNDPAPSVRQSVVWSLHSEVEQDEVKKALEHCLEQDLSVYVKLSAALLLLRQLVISPEIVKIIVNLIQQTPEDSKLDVAQQILMQPGMLPEVLETVLSWCKLTTDSTRREFLVAMLATAPLRLEILRTLVELLDSDPNREIRSLVVNILESNYLESHNLAKDALIKALELEQNPIVRWNCWQALVSKVDTSTSSEKTRWQELYVEINKMSIEEQ